MRAAQRNACVVCVSSKRTESSSPKMVFKRNMVVFADERTWYPDFCFHALRPCLRMERKVSSRWRRRAVELPCFQMRAILRGGIKTSTSGVCVLTIIDLAFIASAIGRELGHVLFDLCQQCFHSLVIAHAVFCQQRGLDLAIHRIGACMQLAPGVTMFRLWLVLFEKVTFNRLPRFDKVVWPGTGRWIFVSANKDRRNPSV